MRTWMTVEEKNGREYVDMPDYLPVTIYADTTGLFTEQEIEEMETSSDLFSEMIEIPVPVDLLKQWWYDGLEFDREQGKLEGQKPEDGWGEVTDKDFWRWYEEESTADDTNTLYDWLVDHNYLWRRLD